MPASGRASADGVERQTLVRLVDRLASPPAPEWSPLTGTAALVVDRIDGGARLADDAARVAPRLRALACPTIALAARAAAGDALLGAFDVVVADREELERVLRGIRRAPLAAATLVHVLRAGAGLELDEALALESLGYGTLQAGPEHRAWLRTRSPAPPPDDEASAVRVERLDDRLVITLDRPARHNAFSARMRDELHAALQIAEAEPRVAVVLRGAGASFSSGGDLDEFGTTPDPATAHLVRTTRSPARALAAVAARVRAEVHGACIGAGIELAALAGTVVARPDAFFELPEIAMGLIPGAGGTATIPRRIGRQRTAWLALTGQRLDAATALAWGLIDAIDEAARIP